MNAKRPVRALCAAAMLAALAAPGLAQGPPSPPAPVPAPAASAASAPRPAPTAGLPGRVQPVCDGLTGEALRACVERTHGGEG